MPDNATNMSQPTTTAGPSTTEQPGPAPSSSQTPAPHSPVSPVSTPSAPAAPSPAATNNAAPAVIPTNAPDQGTATTERTLRKPFFRFEEQFWPWKLGLRILALICGIVGMSTIIWVGVDEGKWSNSDDDYYSGNSWIGALSIPLICSVIFNAIVILVLLFSKRPIHPGAAVGVDLILWLTLVVTGFFCTYAYYSIGWDYDNSSSSYYGNYSSDGESYRSEYYCGSDDYLYNPSDRTCTYSPSACPGYDSCEQRDAYDASRYRRRVLWAGAVFTWLCLVLHFILFVWACVDTHRRNAAKETATARMAAERIVQEMIATGQLVRPAPVFMRPQHPQGPMMPMMEQQQRPLPPIQEYYTPEPRGNAAGKAPEQV